MDRAIKPALGFLAFSVATGLALAALPEPTYEAWDAWTRGAVGLGPVATHIAATLIGLIAIGIGSGVLLDREWRDWKARFRYAGRADGIDLAAIVPMRGTMDQPFADAPRALFEPVTFQTLGQPRVRVAADAAVFLRDAILGRGKRGLLLQGRPVIGKTRFLAEWLRREHPGMMVLAPESSAPMPEVPARLARHSRNGLCLFLDDLELFEARVPEILDRLPRLRACAGEVGAPFIVLATVRDEAPGEAVSGGAFRTLVDGLRHVEIALPTDKQRADAAQKAPGVEEPGDEPSFAFLLAKEFVEQRRRYRDLVGATADAERNALRRLRAAKALDDRGILLARDRVRGVAVTLFDFDGTYAEAADRILRTLGFTDGEAFESSFLRNVVQLPHHTTEALDEALHAHLSDRADAQGLTEWGRALYAKRGNAPFVRTVLSKALDLGESSGTPEGLLAASLAGTALGHALSKEDIVHEAMSMFGRAELAGLESGIPEGLARAALSAFNIGVILEGMGDTKRARLAFSRAESAGREAGRPEGLESAAGAAFVVATMFEEKDKKQMALAAYARTESVGHEAGTPTGLFLAASAAVNIGYLLSDAGDGERARLAYMRAELAGREAGTPEGLAESAAAALNLGVMHATEFDLDGEQAAFEQAQAAYSRAESVGREAGISDGLIRAATAGTNLGHLLRSAEDWEGARSAYERAESLGHEAGEPDGLVEAAEAAFGTGALFAVEFNVEGARAAYERAETAGREANTEEGIQIVERVAQGLQALALLEAASSFLGGMSGPGDS